MTLSKQQIWSASAGAIVIAIAFFFIGFAVGHSKTPARGNFAGRAGAGMGQFQSGANGRTVMRGMGGFANGTILSMTDSSITIKLQNGGSQTAYFTSSTPVMKSVAGSSSDLKTGDSVTVTGTTNADGSLTANSVSIRPAMTAQNNPMMPAENPAQ